MTLKELFRGPSVAALEQQLRELDAKTRSLQDADEDAELALGAKPDDSKLQKARDTAATALAEHNDGRAKVAKQIKAARRRQTAADRDRAYAERKAAWADTFVASPESHEAASDLTAAFVAAADAAKRLL